MTPGNITEYARQQYNSVNDNFFSDAELYRHIWAAQKELAREAKVIERVYTTTTVAGTQSYAFPTSTIAIKRVTYNGSKLQPITMREDDSYTLNNQAVTTQGQSQYYYTFDSVIYLRPLPDSAYTLQIFSYNMPQEVTNSSTLEVPDIFHLGMVDYLLWRMAAKDQNYQAAEHWKGQWQQEVAAAKAWSRKRQRADGFAAVQDEDTLPRTQLGLV